VEKPVVALAFIALIPFTVPAQVPAPEPTPSRFEVVSVKPSPSPDGPSRILGNNPGRFVATNTPLRFLILYAYQLLDHQLADAPGWAYDQGFDVVGTYPSERKPTDIEIRTMLQNVLAERFDLKLRKEERELPAYALVLARRDGRLGPQIHPSTVDCVAWIAEKRPRANMGGASPVTPSGKRPACMVMATRRFLSGGTRTMEDLAGALQSMVSRPVLDRTGLTGTYDVDLTWAPMDLKDGEAASSEEGPSLFTALQEQLGLRLVSQKEKFTVFVIGGVKHPTANYFPAQKSVFGKTGLDRGVAEGLK
jgi:uncharacterized protein (TIGR03435 family)